MQYLQKRSKPSSLAHCQHVLSVAFVTNAICSGMLLPTMGTSDETFVPFKSWTQKRFYPLNIFTAETNQQTHVSREASPALLSCLERNDFDASDAEL